MQSIFQDPDIGNLYTHILCKSNDRVAVVRRLYNIKIDLYAPCKCAIEDAV